MERTDQVLALRDVHRSLAAYRRIHHRQQGGGHLHAVDAAHPAGGGEPGHVADDAAAQRDHRRVAGRAECGESLDHRAEVGQGFLGFAGGDDVAGDVQVRLRPAQRGFEPVGVERCHVRIADQECVAATQRRRQQVAVVEQAGADGDAIGRGAANVDGAWRNGHSRDPSAVASRSASAATAASGDSALESKRWWATSRYSGSRIA